MGSSLKEEKDEEDAQIISPLNGSVSQGSLANCKQGNNNTTNALNGKIELIGRWFTGQGTVYYQELIDIYEYFRMQESEFKWWSGLCSVEFNLLTSVVHLEDSPSS